MTEPNPENIEAPNTGETSPHTDDASEDTARALGDTAIQGAQQGDDGDNSDGDK